jgi:hypothetical protein
MTTAGSPSALRRRMMPDFLPGRWSVVAFSVFIVGAMAITEPRLIRCEVTWCLAGRW